MKNIRQPAIVLQTCVLREADVMTTLLGQKSGKITALAKGARRSKKRFLGGLEVFDCAVFELSSTRRSNDFHLLEGISDRHVWPGLREDLCRFSLASFCLEICNAFTVEGDPEGGSLFNPLFLSLSRLSSVHEVNEYFALASFFALRVLKISGFNLLDDQVEMDGSCRQWLEEMAKLQAPVIPHERSLSTLGFIELIRYAEHTLGHQLKTKEQIEQIIAKAMKKTL